MLPPEPIECPTISNLRTRPQRVTLGRAHKPSYEDDTLEWPPDNIIEYIAWLQDQLTEIPETYRSSAVVDLLIIPIENCGVDDDTVELTYAIYYFRPPTEEETALRIEWHESMSEVRMIRQASRRAEEAGIYGTSEAAKFLLSEEDFEAFKKNLDGNTEPNDALRALMQNKDLPWSKN